MSLRGMSLIFASLFILSAPGLLYNNLSNTGLAPSQVLTCPGYPDVTCQGSVVAGCQLSSTYCTLSGQSVSFLNNNSPFTSLLTGNIFGLFTNLNSANNGGNVQGPFDLFGGGTYIPMDCFVSPLASSKSIFDANVTACTQVTPDNVNMTKASVGVSTWTNWNTQFSGTTVKTPAVALVSNSTYWFKCNLGSIVGAEQVWGNINYTASSGKVGYWWFGCELINKTVTYQAGCSNAVNNVGSYCFIPNQPVFSLLLAFPVSTGTLPSATVASHQKAYAQLTNWDTRHCPAVYFKEETQNVQSSFYSTQCIAAENSLSNAISPNFVFAWFTPILTFLVGIALFIIGIGFNFSFGGSVLGTGTTFVAGTNRQGSKLAQVVGLGLIAWSFFYSEFSSWFTSGILPYGLDGTFGIVSALLTGLFFFGIYDQTTTD